MNITITNKNNLKITQPCVEVKGTRTDLIKFIDGVLKLTGGIDSEITFNSFFAAGEPFYFSMKCSCGKEYKYNKADVPQESVVCKCGQEIIIYQKVAKYQPITK